MNIQYGNRDVRCSIGQSVEEARGHRELNPTLNLRRSQGRKGVESVKGPFSCLKVRCYHTQYSG